MAGRQSTSPPRRRRFQFSLRMLLLAITLCAILLGLQTWQSRRRQRAVEAIGRLGGSMVYGAESAASRLLPPLFFPAVSIVNLQGTETTNEDLEPLAALSGLKSLDLSRTKITAGGLAPLAGLTRLTSLSLAQTGIVDDDLAQLRRLKNLAHLDLGNTAVGDAGLEHLGSLAALESLRLGGTNVTEAGLEHLGGLPRLKWLRLDVRGLDCLNAPPAADGLGDAQTLILHPRQGWPGAAQHLPDPVMPDRQAEGQDRDSAKPKGQQQPSPG